MSTRALVKVYEGKDCLVNLYHHSDGYPSWFGVVLYMFLSYRVVRNGIPYPVPEKFSNGMAELAAQLVHWFKDDNECGGVYLYPLHDTAGAEYLYEVRLNDDNELEVRVSHPYSHDEVYWSGKVDDGFLEWCQTWNGFAD